MRIGRVLALEFDATDGADIIGFLQRIDQLVRIGRAGALERVGEVIDLVIGGVAAIGRIIAVALVERRDERQRLRRHRDARPGKGLIQHAFDAAIGIVPEAGIGGLRGHAEHRNRHFLLLPLHRGLDANVGNAGDDHVRLLALDLVEDRREIGGVGRHPDVIDDFDADIGQAFQIFLVERRRPGRVLAHHHGRLHVQLVDQQILGGVASRVRDAGRRRIAVEGVFEVVVILGDVLRDDVGGGAGRHHHGLQAAGPGLERQHDLADVAGDHRVDVILVGGALERAHGLGGGGMIVVSDNLDLLAVDAACGVDLVGGKLGGLRDRRAGDRLGLGDDADLDGVFRVARRRQHEREAGRPGRDYGAFIEHFHCHSSMGN